MVTRFSPCNSAVATASPDEKAKASLPTFERGQAFFERLPRRISFAAHS